jgi:hypothetical protein
MKLHMAARSRFSTSTVIDSEYIVLWLCADGPLAYSPTKPPARDYFFQYTWILPGIFNPQVNLREHRYFGSPLKDSARFLFDFWQMPVEEMDRRCKDTASSDSFQTTS